MSPTTLKVGQPAPDFNLPSLKGTVRLSDLRGRLAVVYFYPKDDTPGCTKQACGFRDAFPHFEKLQVPVIGISRDSVKDHQKFAEKYNLNFILAADEDGKTCESYGVWVEKNMYGKKSFGIQRATFLIDKNGKIAHIWPKVTPEGHAEEVLEALNNQAKAA